MFKRRRPKSYMEIAGDSVYPRGGWGRALRYMGYRLRRLPDPADKIARGVAAGVFTSFTPFFGLHFLISVGVAWLVRGNILAALLATFVGNPLTFPLIAGLSVELGSRLLGYEHAVPLQQTVGAFSQVSVELWQNTRALFGPEVMQWDRLDVFMDRVFLPYLVGGIGPGIAAGLLAYAVSRPVIAAYQKARQNAARKRHARRQAGIAAQIAAGVLPPEAADALSDPDSRATADGDEGAAGLAAPRRSPADGSGESRGRLTTNVITKGTT